MATEYEIQNRHSSLESGAQRPIIRDVLDGYSLYLDALGRDGAEIIVEKWDTAPRQRYWLKLVGKTSEGNELTIPLAVSQIIDSEEREKGVRCLVSRAEFEKFREFATVEVIFKVTYDGSSNEADATEFPRLLFILYKNAVDIAYFPTLHRYGWESGDKIVERYTSYTTDEHGNSALRYLRSPEVPPKQISPEIILKKDFRGLVVGQHYEFRVSVRKVTDGFESSCISFETSCGDERKASIFDSLNWRAATVSFRAEQPEIQIRIVSHRDSGNFDVDNLALFLGN